MKGLSKIKTSILKARAVKVFNSYIRDRDQNQPCISCGKFTNLQAGHFYSAGKHRHLRFNEDNVNGQCMRCNYFLSGNLLNYRENLISKIGLTRVEKLDLMSHQRTIVRDNRFYFIEIIERYS